MQKQPFSNTGDEFQRRLLLYVKKRLDEPIIGIKQYHKHIWLITAANKKWVMKEFSNVESLARQVELTEALRHNGFTNTYYFHPNHTTANCQFDHKIWGILEYIEPSKKKFSYANVREIKEAHQLLKRYHEVTEQLPMSMKTKFPFFDQINKWKQRYKVFERNQTYLKKYIPKNILSSYLYWAKYSLKQLEPFQQVFVQAPYCITHGDVAHHNFLLGKDKRLYLIDFDLARMAPAWIDDLQFCNRILPSISWSLPKLLTLYEPHIDKTVFLHALQFPTDVLREWNRFSKSDKSLQKNMLPHLEEITFEQFQERKAFFHSVERYIE
ncbi:aminoglycoside phosphotransferase family protein [Bacillus ginsengihumi]|uniref:Aminoglycoside phosphotransferase family protein n=1 Tax=Heyndrickxia ginsengihumi TaxID=363870 RepID=A0A6M0P6X2_9BACI|nr:aminoglycoside phosphotransferase family protein [Heyndrickxia ginsengihumi]NEY20446.1 aminoglycoside phosphotransferase family protein [Heyndrickxia ginsengihumi]